MSKSKKNTVDPETMIKQFGADAVRWFILSDSPPEKDINGQTLVLYQQINLQNMEPQLRNSKRKDISGDKSFEATGK